MSAGSLLSQQLEDKYTIEAFECRSCTPKPGDFAICILGHVRTPGEILMHLGSCTLPDMAYRVFKETLQYTLSNCRLRTQETSVHLQLLDWVEIWAPAFEHRLLRHESGALSEAVSNRIVVDGIKDGLPSQGRALPSEDDITGGSQAVKLYKLVIAAHAVLSRGLYKLSSLCRSRTGNLRSRLAVFVGKELVESQVRLPSLELHLRQLRDLRVVVWQGVPTKANAEFHSPIKKDPEYSLSTL
ncbi:hypothetical protein BXZ70DRAFT_910014 [Cristinia sonorae]|uniref:Uncharacterized protein n=1 Tax=Cristinia sonorae TaxID=1940300 RepID=A0A8K0UIK6_9AGAR|nr:hypothetical protein BXZ70DRAFT_910014 [Cristinia sonorae]